MKDGAASPRRIALGVEYDGTDFLGWQAQRHGVRSVQETLEASIARVADHPVRVQCAGRTDAGVHALEQVVHFDTSACRTARSWVLGTNVTLPPDVSVRWACETAPAFHARFSALSRHYRYRILVRATRSALDRHRALWTHRPLDAARMAEAGRALVGLHDFSSFRAVACQAKSPRRHLYYLAVEELGDVIEIRVGANGFLHHMVRNIVGVLMAIGRGEAPVEWTRELLAARDRRRAGVTAPPQGLYFARVDYPVEYPLPRDGAMELPGTTAPDGSESRVVS
ncbi:tRNA pseudouridine(38-40) synthase TruA [Thiocapsa imhoffii]|uniref:tRNA pseudouridine(38-40) synthase TruA n=1 Tax=Thiocapsa imhoffii TaxID=382777 RepID=UPI001F5BDCCF|nr:tRNA pseudouridine(38-40) synthase TruA [Thiocapsa imhoffii]